MSHAAVASASPALDLTGLREFGRGALRGLTGLLQAAAFAGSLWLLLAGPGCLTDAASTVPAHIETGH